MIIASWNIRGFNKLVKQVEVSTFLRNHNNDILGLLETRVKKNKAPRILQNKFQRYHNYTNYTTHNSGRIWLLWNPSTTSVKIVEEHSQVIHCHVKHYATGISFSLSVVYGSNSAETRLSLWQSMGAFAQNAGPWVAMGDFNVVRHFHEKISDTPPIFTEVAEFNSCLLECGLDDLQGTGHKFTWYNKQDPSSRVYSKLDRVMVNEDWLHMFVQTAAQFLSPEISDHYPALLTFLGDLTPRKQFSFLKCWIKHPDYLSLVARAWDCHIVGNPMHRLMGKLKHVRLSLKGLHTGFFSNITQRIKTKRQELAQCFQDLQQNPSSPALILTEQTLSKEFSQILAAESTTSSPKIKERQQSQIIGEIHGIDEILYFRLPAVGDAFVQYYEMLLGSSTPVQPLDLAMLQSGPCVVEND
ncbi:uncharacterized protein LOC141630724 [Silene latifolia]|uniref:uncharacterized protein LOC141630724 n=1 Tax=Silene latifolia TaxID=37657 RepID=UPI003D784162